MEQKSLNDTINELINNFARHSYLVQENGSLRSNLFDLLQDFWSMKLSDKSQYMQSKPQIVYEYMERPGTPYVCFATLPGGACFATFQNVNTKIEAKKSAALISLMNSILDEHPLRKITNEFINESLEKAIKENPNACSLSLNLYKRMLEMSVNKTMLEFKQMMTTFQLLKWNGSLKALREQNFTLEEVINYYRAFKIDENVRREMSLDWIKKEHEQPGSITTELLKVNREIELTRLKGEELGFLKEKRSILLLASYQMDTNVSIS